MAYLIVYEQQWDSTTATWDDQGHNDPNGSDTAYPEVRSAEGIDIIGGSGPGGENAIDCWASYHGPFQGYDACGVWLNLPTYAARATGLTNIPRGAAEIAYRPNTTSLVTEGGYCLLMNLHADGESSGTGRMSLDVYPSGGNWLLRLRVQHTWGTNDVDPVYNLGTSASLIDDWITFRVEWNRVWPDVEQYVRLLVNGVTVYEENETPDGTDLHANIGKIHGATIGYAGLWGESTNFRIYTWIEEPEPEPIQPPPTDRSKPCPCPDDEEPIGPGPLDARPNPVGPLQPWIQMCETGCAVDSVEDIAPGEVWL